MEGVTDPKMLEDRAFYKLGEFTFDHRKKVLAFGILACFAMASLMITGPVSYTHLTLPTILRV